MGNAIKTAGEIEKAIDAYNRAIQIKPDFAEAHNNLGNALKEQPEAVAAYQRAPAIHPDMLRPIIWAMLSGFGK